MNLAISITSDFICPWCWVAHTRLKQAVEQLGSPISIQQCWYPFELNPDMPVEGMDRKLYRSRKFGSWEYSKLLDAKAVQATERDSIEFRYELMRVTPNTLKAHRLTWLASQDSYAPEMAGRILSAYFSEGQDIGEVEVLVNLAAEVGIKAHKARDFLLSEQGIQEIKELEQRAILKGINGVPAIQIGKEVLTGAQSIETLLSALKITTDRTLDGTMLV